LEAVLRTAIAVLAVAGVACAATPAAERLQQVAPGVKVLNIRLGGLTSEPALTQVSKAFARPITIVFRGETFSISPQQLGAHAAADQAVRRALSADRGTRVQLQVSVSSSAVTTYVDELARRYNTPPRQTRVIGANANGPVIRTGKVGLAVEKATMEAALEQELSTGSRAPLVLMVSAVPPHTTSSSFGPVIVINRHANVLKLYSSTRLVHTFHVATGQAVYPTPSGIFDIVIKEQNPWWRPPPSPWAQGLKPVPPGPGNPLGTRWMGLSASGVGIHGTPNDASIGYSESHGCIRMHIPDAEWLFTHVAVGTPVVIL
jgi:lipoprotein-anchoring transpeptidase ErfK/SrfK